MADVYRQRLVGAEPGQVLSVLERPSDWIDDAIEDAGRFGQSVDVKLRSELGLGRLRTEVGKQARLEVGSARRVQGHYVVPIAWHASGYSGLFPVMDAVLEVHRAAGDDSRLVFWGRYDPPLGRTGALIDRFVAHEVAAATVDRLLDGLQRTLDQDQNEP